ncbi:MAG: putative rane protein [Nocardioidaceae bacterium]|nr:putative rane protein [Nocardioidaceae bacterium]
MLVRLMLLTWFVAAVSLGITAWILDDVTIEGGTLGLLWVAAIFGLVNAIAGPVLQLLSLPLTLLTFGLFALVVNGILLAITAGLTDYLDVGGFAWTVVAAVLISAITAALQLVLLRILEPERVT